MPDETLTCMDCNQPFEFTEGEQTFFASRNLLPPKRCKECRKKKRLARAARDLNPKEA